MDNGVEYYIFIKLSIKWMTRNFEQSFYIALYQLLWGKKRLSSKNSELKKFYEVKSIYSKWRGIH